MAVDWLNCLRKYESFISVIAIGNYKTNTYCFYMAVPNG